MKLIKKVDNITTRDKFVSYIASDSAWKIHQFDEASWLTFSLSWSKLCSNWESRIFNWPMGWQDVRLLVYILCSRQSWEKQGKWPCSVLQVRWDYSPCSNTNCTQTFPGNGDRCQGPHHHDESWTWREKSRQCPEHGPNANSIHITLTI